MDHATATVARLTPLLVRQGGIDLEQRVVALAISLVFKGGADANRVEVAGEATGGFFAAPFARGFLLACAVGRSKWIDFWSK